MLVPSRGQPAAFFRLEGALTSRTAELAAAWLALNSQQLAQRLTRLGAVALAAPVRLAGDATMAQRLAWSGLRGTSEDRLVILGEEYWETQLKGTLRPIALELVQQAKARRHRVVLVSDHPDTIARHAADHLGADDLICNTLELRNGRATGRLADPVVGRLGGQRLAAIAAERGIDLTKSSAYGAGEVDATLLSSIGLPCAVHPDRALRRVARDLDWPVVEG